ncbi:class I SAM-dependent methyltransferase [Undibacterium cyanobacteriorum]|uniref:Class I SAM-dependent methyltransferase n=1 Tax=Undibacterium cyanobacteriorum TaxID=3073561 RepID=A0ABY9RJE0_9BURK|nr:class I SAM-dependent methyltransferase [Undibacterium sp. 20NA77.5]WMW81317.1 class I SAM-dependent methyltransferase [Undibacterium sp. 20NA77.5]
MSANNINWFDQGGAAYANFRPQYPDALLDYLASLVKHDGLVLDVGCGSGQLSTKLAGRFSNVIGLDPSADQLAHASVHPNLRYVCQAAESLEFAPHSVALITAAQAAHWFDLPRFYAAVQRVAQPGAVLALISYGVLHFDETLRDLNARFSQFYQSEIGPYWPPERSLVDSGYAGIDFPFDEIQAPAMEIALSWSRAQFLGYLSTWSAVRVAREKNQLALLQAFSDDLCHLWSEAEQCLTIRWPIAMRVGMVR